MLAEQRQYFRVDTKVLMSWVACENSDCGPQSPITELSKELSTLIHAASSEHPAISKILALLNHKMDAIRDELSMVDNTRKLRRVNISGDGMSFTTSGSVAKGACLDISIVVPATQAHIDIRAEVVICERVPREDDRDLFRIHCRFAANQDDATEQIIRLVADVQREMLAQRRMLLDPDEQEFMEQQIGNG